MEYLEIWADIIPAKMKEFNQSKMTFIENLPKIEGYIGFTEKQGKFFKIKLCWKDHDTLANLMNSDIFKYFHGAIITLSKSNNIEKIKHKTMLKDE